MTIEQQYYENDGFWTDDFFLDQERYRITAAHIPQDARSVLDVGCGNGVFVHLLASMEGRFDEIHGTDRSAAALRLVQTAKTPASIDALPFADRSYDIVTSLEVIEHLPTNLYEAGLDNICRVARKYVLLSVPNEEDIEASLIACPACSSRFSPDYHMRSYNAAKMQDLLSARGFRPRETFFMGEMKHYFLASRLLNRKTANDGRTNPFAVSIPCPVCSYALPPGKVAPKPAAGAVEPGAAADRSGGDSGIKALVKKLLHTRTDYGWVATLYERV